MACIFGKNFMLFVTSVDCICRCGGTAWVTYPSPPKDGGEAGHGLEATCLSDFFKIASLSSAADAHGSAAAGAHNPQRCSPPANEKFRTKWHLLMNTASPTASSDVSMPTNFNPRSPCGERRTAIIGLQLPPLLSSLFLEMTRFTRTVMVRYYRYQCIIDCLFMEDIETVVESHKKLFDE